MRKTPEQYIEDVEELKERVNAGTSPMWEAIQKYFVSEGFPYTQEDFFADLDWMAEKPFHPDGSPARKLSLFAGSVQRAESHWKGQCAVWDNGANPHWLGHHVDLTGISDETLYEDLLFLLKGKSGLVKKVILEVFYEDFRDIKRMAQAKREKSE